jgi:hypothetical protein
MMVGMMLKLLSFLRLLVAAAAATVAVISMLISGRDGRICFGGGNREDGFLSVS